MNTLLALALVTCQLVQEQLPNRSLILSSELSIQTDGETLVLNRNAEALYPKLVANRTHPEIGVITAYKGRLGRNASADSSYVSLWFTSDEVYSVAGSERVVVQGRLQIQGKDATNKSPETSSRAGAPIACDPQVLDFIRMK